MPNQDGIRGVVTSTIGGAPPEYYPSSANQFRRAVQQTLTALGARLREVGVDLDEDATVSGVWTFSGNVLVGQDGGGFRLPVGADRSASGANGSIWVEGTDLHYIDSSGTERSVTGSAV